MAESAEFKKTAGDVRNLAQKPSDAEFAQLYSLYKQATAGDCNIARPGLTDPLGQAKFDAWNAKKGTSKDEAAKAYIQQGNAAAKKYGVK